MKFRILGLAVVIAALGISRASAQSNAKEVIEKSIVAMGGKELLDKYPASRTKFTGELSTMGIEIKFEGTSIQGPGQYKLDMEGDVSGQALKVMQLVDGNKVKTKTSFGGMDIPNMASEAELDELKFSVISQEISQLTPLLAKPKKFTLKAEADEDVDGKKAFVVVVTVKLDEKGEKTKDVKLFFDKKTTYLVKVSRRGMSPGDPEGKEVLHESMLSDYKKNDGIMSPMKNVNFVDGKKFMVLTTVEHKNLEKIDPKEFSVTD